MMPDRTFATGCCFLLLAKPEPALPNNIVGQSRQSPLLDYVTSIFVYAWLHCRKAGFRAEEPLAMRGAIGLGPDIGLSTILPNQSNR